jgi:hypothetical protein
MALGDPWVALCSPPLHPPAFAGSCVGFCTTHACLLQTLAHARPASADCNIAGCLRTALTAIATSYQGDPNTIAFDDSLAGGSITLSNNIPLPGLTVGGSITLVGPPARVGIVAATGTQRTFQLSAAAAPGTFVEFKSLDFLGVVFDVTAAPSELRLTSVSLVGTTSATGPAIKVDGASARAMLSGGVTIRNFKGGRAIFAANNAEVKVEGAWEGRVGACGPGRRPGGGARAAARWGADVTCSGRC